MLLQPSTPSAEYIEKLVAPFIVVPEVTSPHFSRFMYKTVPISQPNGDAAPMICSILDPVESLASEVIFMDGQNCHYGSSSTSGQSLSMVGSSWEVYIKRSESG